MIRNIAVLACVTLPLLAQKDWPAYGHDPGGMRYSPLTQINTGNVQKLKRAWTYHTGDPGNQFEATPVVVGNRLYFSAPTGKIVALEPETGKEIWSYDPRVKRPREHRGVSYWAGDRKTPARIMFGTSDGRLMALDAATGKPALDFGDNGEVNLRNGVADKFPNAPYSITSPPAIYRDLVIVAPSTPEGPGKGPSGDPRAFDARTGKLVWRFHAVPQPGEPGNDTWGPDGWRDRSGPSAWGLIHVDVERGLVVLSTGNAADSWYGGDRPGNNLYSCSVVALDAATGKLRWHYQLTHHDIFDYDVPGGPAVVEVTRNGRKTAVVAQITKMGLLFLLDIETGKPLFGVEERPVPASDIPGEVASPTQPFPVKPLPLVRTSIKREDLARRTPESTKYCEELFDKVRVGGLYTPYGSKTTLVFPGPMGGGNWGGVSADPKLGYVFVNTTNMGALGHLVPSAPGAEVPYRNESGYARFLDNDHFPCQRPPWGELSAVDVATGDIAWKVTLGNFDELSPAGSPKTGTPNVGGSIATAGGLVFVAATNDSKLRAFNSRTGEELWAGRLEATGNATPITYQGRDGQQYVVIAAGGPMHLRNVGDNSRNKSDALVAFALNGKQADPVVTSSAPAATVTTARVASGELPEGAGRAEVMAMCTACHGTTTFAGQRLSGAEWKSEVDSMVARGAKGTEAQIRAVVEYLTRYLGKETK